MNVVIAYPPNILELQAAFNVGAHRGVFYTYGQTIYNPEGLHIPGEIMDHERVHAERQGSDPESWWVQYIRDVEFRLAEELLGHIAEYRGAVKRRGPGKRTAEVLDRAAARLASPLYGSIITPERAKRAILEGKLP